MMIPDLWRTIRSQTLKSGTATYRVPFGVNFRKFNVSSRFTVRILGVMLQRATKLCLYYCVCVLLDF